MLRIEVILGIIATIVLLVAAVGVMNGVGLRRAGKNDEGTMWILGSVLAVIVLVFGWGAFRSFHSVDAGHVLVVRQFGEIVGQRDDGFQTIAPWQSGEEVSAQVESRQFQFRSVEVAPNRELIRREVQAELDRQLEEFSIDVVDFLINDLEFPQEFTQAIERKQVATQDALAAEQRVAQSMAEAQQEIERARGQAQAQRLRANALTDRNIQFEALQIFKENPPEIIFLPSGSGTLLDPSTFLKSGSP